MESLGLAAIVGLLLVKEAGLPLPLPGDLLVLGAGVAAATGSVEPISTLVLIVAATIAGGLVQFSLLRGSLRVRLLAVLRRVGLSEARVERLAGPLRARGAAGIAIARMTPGVRIVAIPAAALAAVAPRSFVTGLVLGNAVFVTGHFLLGALLGPPAVAMAGSVGPALIAIVGGLAVVGLAGWLAIRLRSGAARAARDGSGGFAAAAGDWSDAACPACLLLGAGSALINR
jgi:membrane protein DedA with SNARE-associated domain